MPFSRPKLVGLTPVLVQSRGSCGRGISIVTHRHSLSHTDILSPGNFITVSIREPWTEDFLRCLWWDPLPPRGKSGKLWRLYSDLVQSTCLLLALPSCSFPQPRAHATAGTFPWGLPWQWETTSTPVLTYLTLPLCGKNGTGGVGAFSGFRLLLIPSSSRGLIISGSRLSSVTLTPGRSVCSLLALVSPSQ